MAITNAKVTMFFKDLVASRAGWTENFFVAGNNLRNIWDSVFTSALFATRRQLLPADYGIMKVRVSTVPPYDATNPRGMGTVGQVPIEQGRGLYPRPPGPIGDDSEEPYDCLNFRMETATSKRIFQMRGLPAGIVKHTTGYDPDGPWIAIEARWIAAMIAFGVQIRTMTPLAPHAATTTALSSGDRALLFTFPAGQLPFAEPGPPPVPPITPGSIIRVSNLIPLIGANRNWRVRIVGATVLETYPAKFAFATTVIGPATIQLLVPSYNAINSIEAGEGSKRATGRPFDVLVGKRSRRRN